MSGFNRYRGNMLRIQQSTQPITITDIMAAPYEQLPNGNYLGEFNMPVPNNNKNIQADLKTRIGDHIEHLVKMADLQHEKANFTEGKPGEFKFIPGNENKITRLSTYEFMFYPEGKPLTLDQYQAILIRIRDIAEKSHENLHLLLATFPVE